MFFCTNVKKLWNNYFYNVITFLKHLNVPPNLGVNSVKKLGLFGIKRF